MGQEIITFSDIEIEKHKFHRYQNPNFFRKSGRKISSGEEKTI